MYLPTRLARTECDTRSIFKGPFNRFVGFGFVWFYGTSTIVRLFNSKSIFIQFNFKQFSFALVHSFNVKKTLFYFIYFSLA